MKQKYIYCVMFMMLWQAAFSTLQKVLQRKYNNPPNTHTYTHTRFHPIQSYLITQVTTKKPLWTLKPKGAWQW